MISLHKNATTRPRIRQRMSGSDEPTAVLALRYGVSEETARKWKQRDSVHDLLATPHTLQTTLTVAQEAEVVELRRLLLPLDDLLAVMREFLNPDVSRSGLDRSLQRHGVSNLKALLPKAPTEARKTFKTYEPGFLLVDVKYLPQMADETTRRYLFVAIDRATRWVFVRILPAKTAANARRLLRDLSRACPIRISKILIDNGKEFTDQLCAELGIGHRLTPPKSPPDQRHGRTVRRADLRRDENQSLRQRPRPGANPYAIRRTLQHAIAAVRLGEPNTDASDEGLVQVPPPAVRQITPQPSGTRYVINIRNCLD